MSARTVQHRHSPVINLTDSNRGKFSVVHRIPTLQGEPEWVVAEGERYSESIAHFFSQMDAQSYANWRNGTP